MVLLLIIGFPVAMILAWGFELTPLTLTPVALIRLRTKDSDLPRPFKVWEYLWMPLLFGIIACAIAVNLWMVRPIRSSVGLAIILLGVPFTSLPMLRKA